MKAIIFAAGLGTRLRPLTDTKPKALVSVAGQTLLEYQIRKLQAAGINDIIVNVHHFPDMIIDYLRANNSFGANISVSDERDNLLDTGGGLYKAWSVYAAGEPIMALNVDILSQIDLREVVEAYNAEELGVLVVKSRETQRYLCFDKQNTLCGWTNIATGQVRGRDGSHLAFSGMQLLSPNALPLLQDFAATAGSKFSVIDFYLHVVEQRLGTLRALELDTPLFDVGKIEQLKSIELTFFSKSEAKRS